MSIERTNTRPQSQGRASQIIQRPQHVQSSVTNDLDLQQKIIINRLIRELSSEQSVDIQAVLQKPHIHRIFKEEFNMTDKEILDLEKIVIRHCDQIINNFVKTETLIPLKGNYNLMNHQAKQQPLSLLQKKELDHYLELDYSQYPAQPCVRSLYYVSKIAQTQQIKILVPPTILIGFGDDNRMMHNDPQNGSLIIKTGYISPKIIQQFIQKHMINEQLEQRPEERILFPKFVIKLDSKNHTKNDIRIYYSRDNLIADLMSFWGTYDMAIQIFVKQKHLRPSIYRYYMKNGNVYKAVSISNQENLTKETRMYKSIINLVSDQFEKTKKLKQTSRPKSGINLKRRDGIIQITKNGSSQEKLYSAFPKKQTLEQILNSNNQNEDSLDEKGFPFSLQNFKINEFHNELQQQLSMSDLKKYFCCSTDNMDNLAMMSCRPGAQSQADKMTLDLFRLFQQYYLKTQKFGNISQFVCDFIEAENGLTYLLQIKSFECEGLMHDWQAPWSPMKLKNSNLMSPNNAGVLKIEDDLELQQSQCQAQILCIENKLNPDLREMFSNACFQEEIWTFNNRKGQLPKISTSIIEKYHNELSLGKDSFLLNSEKSKISPLYPLTTFSESMTQQSHHSPRKTKNLASFKIQQSFLINNVQNGDSKTPMSVNQEDNFGDSMQNQMNGQELKIKNECVCCFPCAKVLELFQSRYYALVFKTEQTVEELKKLKTKLVNEWKQEDLNYLIKIYKKSKNSLFIISDIYKLEKKKQLKMLKERAKTPESVVEKQLKRNQNTIESKRIDSQSSHKKLRYKRGGSSLKRSIDTFQELQNQVYNKSKGFNELSTYQYPGNSTSRSYFNKESQHTLSTYPKRLLSARGSKPNLIQQQVYPSQSKENQNEENEQKNNKFIQNQFQSNSTFNLMQSQIYNYRKEKKKQSLLNVGELLQQRDELTNKIKQQLDTIENVYSDFQPQQIQTNDSVYTFNKSISSTSINGQELQQMQKRYSLKLNYDQQLTDLKTRNIPSAYSINSGQKSKIKNTYKQFINANQIGSSQQQQPQINQNENQTFFNINSNQPLFINSGYNQSESYINDGQISGRLQTARNPKSNKINSQFNENNSEESERKSITFLMQKRKNQREQDKSMSEYFNKKREMDKQQSSTFNIVNRLSSRERPQSQMSNKNNIQDDNFVVI